MRKVNQEELNYAAHMLASELAKQLTEPLKQIAMQVMTKFDRGPKPRPDEKAQIMLKIEIEGRSMYEVADRVRMYKEGYVPNPNSKKYRR